MKTIKLSQDIEHEGLVAGDVLSVDDNSAAALIRSGRAEEYDPQKARSATADVAAEPSATTYGEQEGVRTIDDIKDPQAARNRRVMSFATVAAADHGPVAADPAAAEAPADADGEPDAEVVDSTGSTHTGTLPTSASADAADTAKAQRPGRPGRPGTTTTSAQAAPDAKSAGGDAGGGDS